MASSSQRQTPDADRGKTGQSPMGNKDTEMSKGQPDASRSSSARGIKEHMEVIASCGTKVGVVDRVEGDAIKLTKGDSPDGQHHFIPTAWVENVDNQVHLKKNSKEAEQGWKSDAASCGCGG